MRENALLVELKKINSAIKSLHNMLVLVFLTGVWLAVLMLIVWSI
jgi:hypothetical protein